MNSLRVKGIPALLVLCVGMAFGQDTSHDVNKTATKTAHVVKHTDRKTGHATRSGITSIGHGTKVVAKGSVDGVK